MSTETPETIGEGRFLRLVRQGRWEHVERIRTNGVVAIVAVTQAGELVLVEQIRPAIGGKQVELPAGLVEPGEDFEETARRELMEETGFAAESFELLGTCAPSAGLTSETLTFYRAHGAHRVAEGGGDETEDITVHLVSLAGLRAWLVTQGSVVDMKIYAGLYLVG